MNGPGDANALTFADAREKSESIPVVFISSHATQGGSERYLALLLERLDPSWIRTVVCLQDGIFADDLRARGLPVEVMSTGTKLLQILASAWRLRRLLLRSGSVVVHANGVKAAIVAAAATIGTRISVIWFKHDVSHDGWQARLVAMRCARVVAVSAAVTTTFRGRTREKIEVLHCQIPEPSVDPVEARRLVLSLFEQEEPAAVVALVGRFDAFKGHREILACAPQILEHVPRTRFLFIGGDDPAHPGTRKVLHREAKALRVDHSVLFVGYRNDAATLICGSDVLVIPSVADEQGIGVESFSYVGIEALALGTPVVGYAHGGLPEVLGQCGTLVPPGDRRALAESILNLVENPGLRERLALRGREHFRAHYVLSSLVDDVTDRYRQVALGGKPG